MKKLKLRNQFSNYQKKAKALCCLVLLSTIISMSGFSQSINLSFPGGFDNCMAPTPNAGTYNLAGTMNGKNYYTKGAFLRIIWSGSQWLIQGDDPAISGVSWYSGYVNSNNTTLPPADCWTSPAGCFLPLLSGGVTSTIATTTISRTGYNIAVSGTASFTVVFSGPVSALSASNFTTVNTGTVTGSSVGAVTQVNSTTWTVVVNTGTGDGTVGLNFINGTGTGSAFCHTFPVTGATYTVNTTAAPVTLGAGDIAFTGYNSSSTTTDNFSFIVLKSGGLPLGTKIYFTDNGYGTVESGMRPGEGLMLWTATAAVAQFAQVTVNSILSPVSYTVTAGSATAVLSNINLSNSGDQILAFQGTMASPSYISAIQMNAETAVGTTNGNSTLSGWDDFVTGTTPYVISTARSAIPPGLTNGTDAVMPVSGASVPYTELDNAVYNCTGATLATTLATLRSAINDRNNWSKQDATVYTIPPSCTFSVAASSVINTSGTLSAFSSCAGTASAAQSFIVNGTSLTAALVITAPTGFEVSITAGSGYAASVSLTPSGGTVNNTTIYVRIKSTTTGTPSGNVSCTSTGAATKNVAASGSVSNPVNWYLDADNDGHYTAGPVSSCTTPGAGYNTTATLNGDCNDADNSKWQSASLYIDNDNDGYTNGTAVVCYGAAIPSGYKSTSLGTDCDDNDNTKWQSASLYIDNDNDGYTNGTAVVCYGASIPLGYKATSLGSDCNDNSNTVYPGATEILCNGIDENCNGMADDGVSSTAATDITSDAPFNEVCIGDSATLTLNGGSLGTGASWKWYSGSCNGTHIGSGTSITVTPSVNTTYYVKAEGGCNSTACVQLTIAVKTAPPAASVLVPPINNLPAYACTGNFINNLNVPSVSNASHYIWDGPTGTTFNGGNNPFTSATPSANITFGIPNGSGYFIGVQAANACGVSLRKVQWSRGSVSVPASVDPAIATLQTYCANTTATFSCPLVGGATGYQWSITGDATVVPSGNSVTVNFGSAWSSGNLCVSALTPCFTSAPKCLSLSTAQAPAYNSTGVYTVCGGATHNYSVPADLDVVSYAWTLPPNSTGSSITNSINVTYILGFAAGNICVQATSICGVQLPQKCKSVTSGAATTPASITGASSGLCGTTTTFTCPPQAGATFNWSLPSGATGSSNSNSIAVTFPGSSFTTGLLSVTAVNACGPSSARTITVKGPPNTPGTITANPVVWCNNDAGIQFASNLSGVSGSYDLTWSVIPAARANYVNGQGTNSYLVDWNTGNATVMVTASNGCGSGSRTYSAVTSCKIANNNNEFNSDENVKGEVTIFPNPSNGKFVLKLGIEKKQTIEVQITDITGKTVGLLSYNLSDGKSNIEMDFSKQPKGVYQLKVKTNEITFVKKIVIQ